MHCLINGQSGGGGDLTVTRTVYPKNMLVNGSLRSGYDGWTPWAITSDGSWSYSWGKYDATPSADGLILHGIITVSSGVHPYTQAFTPNNSTDTQVFYCRASVRGNATNTTFPVVYLRMTVDGTTSYVDLTDTGGASGTALNTNNAWHTMSLLISLEGGVEITSPSIAFGLDVLTAGNEMTIRDVVLVNLTDFYGSGNEPQKSWCDTHLTFANTRGGIVEEITWPDSITYTDVDYTPHQYTNLITNGSLASSTTGWTMHTVYDVVQNDGYVNITNGSNTSSSTTGVFPNYQLFTSVSGNTAASNQYLYVQAKVQGKATNKYQGCVYLRYYKNGSTTASWYYTTPVDGNSGAALNDGGWHTLSALVQTYYSSSDYRSYDRIAFGISTTNTIGDSASFRDIIVLNLTDIFGSGNEPTKAWCDANIRMDGNTVTDNPGISKVTLNGSTIIDLTKDNPMTSALRVGTQSTGGDGLEVDGMLVPAYKFLTSRDVNISTTSTSASSVGTIDLGAYGYTSDKIIYVKVRDVLGPRTGYFSGSDVYFYNHYPQNGATNTLSAASRIITARDGSGNVVKNNYNSTNGYGVYGYSIDSAGLLTIYKRYSSTISYTVDSTYRIYVYTLEYVDPGGNPFNYKPIS